MLSKLSAWFVNPRRNPLARAHRNAVASRLRKYGLRYDDLYDPYHDLDIKEALSRLPREVVDARNQRLKRAMDLSMKHKYLPDEVQVKKEKAEREALGALPLYQRTIP
uniref:Cytochrome b-c1 complex subunit 7 n=1 Tax=Setaria italica TaxID=4555 RepID=K3ZYA7_SETIT